MSQVMDRDWRAMSRSGLTRELPGRYLVLCSARRRAVRSANGTSAVERRRGDEVGWYPRTGSYEEAVLTWYEQVELSFRHRRLAAERTSEELETSRQAEAHPPAPHRD